MMTKLLWRSRDSSVNQAKIIRHDVFLKRIQKSLYCSAAKTSNDNGIREMPAISRPFADYAAEVFSEPHRGYSLNRLQSVTISRLKANPCSLILAMIYLERLQDSDPMYAKKITPTELFLVSMMISTKFYCGYDEETMYANDWAEQGNMSAERIKQLELELLNAVNWNIYVSNQVFFDKLQSIEILLARRQGLQRGWLTYTELANLIPSISIATSFLQYSAVFMMSYAASVVTIAGAFFLASQVPGTALYCSKTSVPTTASSSSSSANIQNIVNEIDYSTVMSKSIENRKIALKEQRLQENIDIINRLQQLHDQLQRTDNELNKLSPLYQNRSMTVRSIRYPVERSSHTLHSISAVNNFTLNLKSIFKQNENDNLISSCNLTTEDAYLLRQLNRNRFWYLSRYDFLSFLKTSWS